MVSKRLLALGTAILVCGATPGSAWAQEGEPPAPSPFQSQELGGGPWDIQAQDVKLHVEVVTRELDHPWGIAFLPDGGMLVTERPGRLRVIRDGELDPRPIEGLPPVFAFGIAGLSSVVLHPDFANNRLIYLSYSKARPEPGEEATVQSDSALAVLRARWDGGYRLEDVEEIFVAEPWYGAPPAVERCCGQGPTFGSYGARMVFGADGKLYITSGDRNYGELVQDPSTHFGKIIRLNDDGSVPDDNPFIGKEGWRPEIYTTGHRNPTGLTVHPESGQIWSTEFGPRGGDELNLIERGANYGWIAVTQGYHYDGTPAEGIRKVPGMTDPVWSWGPPSHNPGNLDFYTGSLFAPWEGDLLVAMVNRSLVRFEINEQGFVTHQETMLEELSQRLRDVRVAPDGSIYVLTDETGGAILRITPAPAE